MDELLPGENIKLQSGQEIKISPVPLGRLKDFSRAVAKLMQKLKEEGNDLSDLSNLGVLFETCFDEIVSIMASVLQKEVAFITEKVTISDSIAILEVIIRQNITDEAKKNLVSILDQASYLSKNRSSS